MTASDVAAYLAMQRETYAGLAARSDYATEGFARSNAAELVVGSYALHEEFDYERWLLGGLAMGDAARALEYGCGPGRMLLRFAPRFARIDGVDLSPELLEIARRRCASLATPPALIQTDGQDLPRDLDGQYDLAFSVICLQHICVHGVRRAILEALFRCLRPGGILTFQMGYGPGHAACVGYTQNYTAATGTNGTSDVTILHPGELGADLEAVGFTPAAYALTPTGPGDVHAAWIFARAVKPGRGAALELHTDRWPSLGFHPLGPEREAVHRAREWHHSYHALTYQHRELGQHATRLAKCVAVLEDRERTLEAQTHALRQESDSLSQRVAVLQDQLQRLAAADRPRVRERLAALVREAAQHDLRVGLFGAGAHSLALLDETDLPTIRSLFLFDNSPSLWGRTVRDLTVRAPRDIPSLSLDVMLVSSLAFEPDIVEQLAELQLADLRIVRCYEAETDRERAAP